MAQSILNSREDLLALEDDELRAALVLLKGSTMHQRRTNDPPLGVGGLMPGSDAQQEPAVFETVEDYSAVEALGFTSEEFEALYASKLG